MHVITTIRKVSRYQRGDRNSKDRQFNGQTKKKRQKDTCRQNTTQKTND